MQRNDIHICYHSTAYVPTGQEKGSITGIIITGFRAVREQNSSSSESSCRQRRLQQKSIICKLTPLPPDSILPDGHLPGTVLRNHKFLHSHAKIAAQRVKIIQGRQRSSLKPAVNGLQCRKSQKLLNLSGRHLLPLACSSQLSSRFLYINHWISKHKSSSFLPTCCVSRIPPSPDLHFYSTTH